jgi:hypothetical protein
MLAVSRARANMLLATPQRCQRPSADGWRVGDSRNNTTAVGVQTRANRDLAGDARLDPLNHASSPPATAVDKTVMTGNGCTLPYPR